MRICIYGASSDSIPSHYKKIGEEFGKKAAERGHGIVFGGGAKGMMGAVARGVSSENGELIGVAPDFFNVDGVLFEGCDKSITTKTMRDRKKRMEKLSDAFAVLPGGIGTFDEFFEILTFRQLGLHSKPIAILNTNGFYDGLLDFLKEIIKEGFLIEKGFEMFDVCDNPSDVLDILEKRVSENLKPEVFKILD